jgi:hypothetical protein
MDGRPRLTFLEFLTATIGGIWKFVSNIITIGFVAGIVIFIIAVFMPENMQNAIEIFKNLFQIP